MESIVPGMAFPGGHWLDFLDFGQSVARCAGRPCDGCLGWIEFPGHVGRSNFGIRLDGPHDFTDFDSFITDVFN